MHKIVNLSFIGDATQKQDASLRMGLRVRALLFISIFLALAIGITVVAMSWNARTIVIEQVERDVDVLSRVLSQSISISQQPRPPPCHTLWLPQNRPGAARTRSRPRSNG